LRLEARRRDLRFCSRPVDTNVHCSVYTSERDDVIRCQRWLWHRAAAASRIEASLLHHPADDADAAGLTGGPTHSWCICRSSVPSPSELQRSLARDHQFSKQPALVDRSPLRRRAMHPQIHTGTRLNGLLQTSSEFNGPLSLTRQRRR